MRREVEQALREIEAQESIVARLDVIFNHGRAPLLITSTQLICVSELGDRLAVPLHHVHRTHYEELGTFKRKPFRLHVGIGAEEVTFGLPGCYADDVIRFVAKLDQAAKDASDASSQQRAPVALSVADELAKFAALRDQGVITQQEFDAKKAQLLG